MADVTPIRVRGQSGDPFDLDPPVPGTVRGEVLVGQIRKGELQVLDDDDEPIGARELEDALSEWTVEVESTKAVREGRDGPRDRSAVPAGDTAADNEPPAEPEGSSETSDVPTGNIDEVLDWVLADDADQAARAQAALDAELERDHPRSTLVERLEAIVEGSDDPDKVEVPDGDVDEVLAWVEAGDDADELEARARAALEQEQAKGNDARDDLVEQLEGLIG